MKKILVISLFLLASCGAGDGTNNDDQDDNSSSSAGSTTINITGGGEGSSVEVVIADSADSQNNGTLANNNTQDPESCSSCGDGEMSEFAELAPDLDEDQIKACVRCCSDDNEISEASCVDETEGENNVNGDCPGELLVAAGCSPDLSAQGCFLCKELGLDDA